MKIAMTYFKPSEEAENLCTYVSAVYRSYAQKGASPPAAEDIFPELCSFAASNGLVEPMQFRADGPGYLEEQIQKLRLYVQHVFKTAPPHGSHPCAVCKYSAG